MRTISIVAVVGLLVALPATAVAENLCRANETQAECHARFKCRADEGIELCQRRVMQCRMRETLEECRDRRMKAAQENQGRSDDGGGGRDDRRDDDRSDRGGGGRDDDRSDRGGRDDDRSDRGRRGDGGGRDDRRDRGRRERDRDDDRGDRGRRGDGGGRSGRSGGEGGGSRAFVANKTFGLGLELGEPTGLTGKVFISDRAAFDFGIGANYGHYYYDDGLHLYGDFLFHPVSLTSNPSFELPFYFGFGMRFWDFEYCVGNVCGYNGEAVGLRIPLGLAFDFNNAPLDIFVQIVPVFDFLDDDYYDQFGDRRHSGVDFSVGLRYWFM